MKASDAVAQLLAYKDVHFGFELIGGMIAHLVDSINRLGKTKLVSVHHEQAAAFAAGGIARATDNKILGVALGTSGPGATNLMTGIADCWLDNVPCLFITGQVNLYESKGNKKIKQQGFQELDIVKLVESITKYAIRIDRVEMLLPELNKAIDIARSGRQGPVLIDIPMNIQRETIDESELEKIMFNHLYTEEKSPAIADVCTDIAQINQQLLAANKPLVLFGGGAVHHDLLEAFLDYLHVHKIPYVTSLKGSENVPAAVGNLGMIGSYGTRTANYAIQNSDLLLVIASRLDVRQTGADCSDFARNARIIQIDIDEHQLNNRIHANKTLHIDVGDFYKEILKSASTQQPRPSWLASLERKKSYYYRDEYAELKLSPFALFDVVNKKFKDINVQFVCDVGNNQMWAAHTLQLSKHQKVHHSGGLGAMGFSIPTSIGVQLATGQPVVSFSGDGGAQINIQELDIIARENLPVLVIILNNKALGMVRNFQEMYFDGRDESTYWRQYSCDFVQIAKGYNLRAVKVATLGDFGSVLEAFVQDPYPCVLEVDIEFVNECRPRIAFGEKLDGQTPNINVHNLLMVECE